MKKFVLFALIAVLCGSARASWYWPFDVSETDEPPEEAQSSWYWPFGSSGTNEPVKRVSELVEPASLLIDAASDLAAEGKTSEAIEKYRAALAELDTIAARNVERAKSAEFATVRNKQAYVNAAIDSLLLGQVQANAKVVAVSDTTELERRLDRERWGKRLDAAHAAINRRDSDRALTELEKAKAGTTNVVQLAITYGVFAGAYCQMGEFEKACRFLELYSKELVRAGVRENRETLTAEERLLVSENLRIVRDRVVGGYGRSFVDGRQVCEDSARLGTLEDLTTTNAIALASNVVVRLEALQKDLSVFAFPQARRLSGIASGLWQRAAESFERMRKAEQGENASTSIVWRVETSGLKSGLMDFRGLADRVGAVDRRLSVVMRLVDGKKDSDRELSTPINPPQSAKLARSSSPPRPSKAPKSLAKPLSRRDRVMSAISTGDWTTAKRLIDEMLVEKPNGAAALNLKAAMEFRQEKLKEAEDTLDQAIMSNPRSHFAYYNMARLMLRVRADDKSVAKRYYETGRTLNGPVDANLEEAFK